MFRPSLDNNASFKRLKKQYDVITNIEYKNIREKLYDPELIENLLEIDKTFGNALYDIRRLNLILNFSIALFLIIPMIIYLGMTFPEYINMLFAFMPSLHSWEDTLIRVALFNALASLAFLKYMFNQPLKIKIYYLTKLDLMKRGLSSTTREVLAGLSDQEAKVLNLRFGIDPNSDNTLDQAAEESGLSKSEILSIEKNALRKLRHPGRSDQLRSFLDGGES